MSCLMIGVGAAAAFAQPTQPAPSAQQAMQNMDPQMKAVLDALAALQPKPIATLTPEEARQQPTPAMAAANVMANRGIDPSKLNEGIDDVDDTEVTVTDANGANRDIDVRVYRPAGGTAPRPVIVYAHGGGWVIATLDTYDASCRALCKMTNAIVISVDYRQAPEHKFPAAHEDVFAVYQWALQHAADWDGDANRVAIAGESAGGNIAAAVSLMAKDRGVKLPVHQLLVYPITTHNFETPSYVENANAKPLNRAMMQWFFQQYVNGPQDLETQYLLPSKATREQLQGLPPTTIVTAQIDPLRSDGEMYAEMLRQAGVDVAHQNFDGVTHEFFGMGLVVDKAMQAEQFAADRLNVAFAAGGGPTPQR